MWLITNTSCKIQQYTVIQETVNIVYSYRNNNWRCTLQLVLCSCCCSGSWQRKTIGKVSCLLLSHLIWTCFYIWRSMHIQSVPPAHSRTYNQCHLHIHAPTISATCTFTHLQSVPPAHSRTYNQCHLHIHAHTISATCTFMTITWLVLIKHISN